MRAFAMSLMVIGCLTNLIGGIMILVVAKRVSALWFIGCLLSIAMPIFVVAYWQVARRAFLIWLAGALAAGLASMMVPDLCC
ncbi:MAG: hypothetical protein JNN07_28655 [Verrucomicrobiales bacterium]|nr:hypothetical protein [Verrucomicrobiales bacterium]